MRIILLHLFCLYIIALQSQVNYSAHDTVTPYQGSFGYGTNAGYFPPHTNVQISSLAAGDSVTSTLGAGSRSIRGAIPHDYITTWGLNADLAYWQHNDRVGLKDNVAFIGFPHSTAEDPHLACGGVGCPVHNLPHKPGNFTGLYLPIWDNGANGTPINDSNTYAKYVYDIATTYKDYVRFWEIWNEPDFSFSPNAYAPPSDPNSWWNRSNFECDCPCMAGTIYNYVRLLRISWEVIKSVDSTAYICTGGLGYSSFLDAVLRYTDNPLDGSSSAAYPLTGGAYFDVLSFHVYPQYSSEVKQWDNNLGRMVYNRHSDGAANGVRGKKLEMENVLHARGYDGVVYPEKEWILTEHNISRSVFGDLVGGEEAQRNYMMKSLVMQQLDDVKQSYVYGLAEKKTIGSASGSFDLMGMYESLTNRSINQPLTSSGVANRSLSQALYGTVVDPVQTAALNLPNGVSGGAFRHSGGHYSYVLWAEATTDRSEQASVTYSFPVSLQLGQLQIKAWNYAQTGLVQYLSPSNITLSGTPIILTEQNTLPVTLIGFDAFLQSDATAKLSWETASESQNDFFTLERSTDGVLFEVLGRVPGSNLPEGDRYNFIDENPLQGKSVYRLGQVDLDGNRNQLETVELVRKAAPFNLKIKKVQIAKGDEWEVVLLKNEASEASVSLLGIDGKTYYERRVTTSKTVFNIPSSTLTSGMYILVYRVGESVLSKKLQLLPR